MTRREDIESISIVSPNCFETDREEAWYNIGCMDGLSAADEEPNLKRIWHDVSEEPEIGFNIVFVDKYGHWWDIQPYNDGNYDWNGLKGWACCVNINHIQKWAYISDLLPK